MVIFFIDDDDVIFNYVFLSLSFIIFLNFFGILILFGILVILVILVIFVIFGVGIKINLVIVF